MADTLAAALKKAIIGSKDEEIIKAGTLAVTRCVGIVALALVGTFLLLDQLGNVGPWPRMTTTEKLQFVIAAAAVWAAIAGADSIARGLATARQNDFVATLPAGLKGTKTEGIDDRGWSVVAVKFPAASGSEGAKYLVIKAGKPAEWLDADKLKFG